MLTTIPRVEHVTYAVAVAQRDTTTAMSAHPGQYVIDDRTAATIASWYQSPGACCTHITALSHGMPFDTDALLAEIHDEIEPIDSRDAVALRHWLDAHTARLTHADYLRETWCSCGPFGHESWCYKSNP